MLRRVFGAAEVDERICGNPEWGPLISRKISEEEMRWEVLGFARGFVLSACYGRLLSWEQSTDKEGRKTLSHVGAVPHPPGQKPGLVFGDRDLYCDAGNSMYTFMFKVGSLFIIPRLCAVECIFYWKPSPSDPACVR